MVGGFRRYGVWVGGALLALLVIVIVSVVASTQPAAADSVSSTGPSVSNNGAGISGPQALISSAKKTVQSSSIASKPVPFYKHLTGSRFFLPGLVGVVVLAVIAVVVVVALTVNQKKDASVNGISDQEDKSYADEVEEDWFSQNLILTGLVVVGTVVVVIVLSVLVGRFLRRDDKKTVTPVPATGGAAQGQAAAAKVTAQGQAGGAKSKIVGYTVKACSPSLYSNGNPIVYAKAKYDYLAVDTSQKSIKNNGIVYLVENVDKTGSWLQVRENDIEKAGWVPASYVVTKVGGPGNVWKDELDAAFLADDYFPKSS